MMNTRLRNDRFDATKKKANLHKYKPMHWKLLMAKIRMDMLFWHRGLLWLGMLKYKRHAQENLKNNVE